MNSQISEQGNNGSGTGNFRTRTGNRSAPISDSNVSVHFSHACSVPAGCDLTSTARSAEEESISVEMASGLPG